MTCAMRLIPTLILAIVISTAAVADTAERCKEFVDVPAASPDKDVNSKISNTAIRKFIKYAGENVEVENTYHFVRRTVWVGLSNADKATYEEGEYRFSIWRQVLLMQCVLLAESTALSNSEKTNAIDKLLSKRSLRQPPQIRQIPKQ